jgi:hypothetical protein
MKIDPTIRIRTIDCASEVNANAANRANLLRATQIVRDRVGIIKSHHNYRLPHLERRGSASVRESPQHPLQPARLSPHITTHITMQAIILSFVLIGNAAHCEIRQRGKAGFTGLPRM